MTKRIRGVRRACMAPVIPTGNGGSVLVDLHMNDGSAVPVQLSLEGAEDFLNTAFLGWVQQNNIDIRNTHFHDPKNSCWFPSQEVE